jgi:hypothetical protein
MYHLTDERNISRVRRTMKLESAVRLLTAAGRSDLLRARRRQHEQVSVDGEIVYVRDQAPLHAGNMALEAGWTLSDFVYYLNERVFFWPGTALGPIVYGRRHFERYAAERPAIIRMQGRSLTSANPDIELRFCKYNSGSPRWTQGRPSPRTAQTFVLASEAPFRPSAVVEVTVAGSVCVSDDAEVSTSPDGPWAPLLRAGTM